MCETFRANVCVSVSGIADVAMSYAPVSITSGPPGGVRGWVRGCLYLVLSFLLSLMQLRNMISALLIGSQRYYHRCH